jgi:hypothetical protein
MLTCSLCGQEIKTGESHDHTPDFFLDVWNCQARLVRSIKSQHTTTTETLPFNLPDKWVDYVLATCGGAINLSGQYRLPGNVWEWVTAKSRGDEQGARFIAQQIDKFLESWN